MKAVVEAKERFARQRAGQIRQGMRDYIKTLGLVKQAWEESDWKTLGYGSWIDYLDGEFGAERLGLPPEHREKALTELRMAGMSVRAIAETTGKPKSSIGDGLSELSGAGQLTTPEKARGLDEKTRPTSRPPLVEAVAQAIQEAAGEAPSSVPLAVEPDDPGPTTTREVGPERPKPPAWDPAERRAHEEEVQKRLAVEAARRTAQTIVTTVLAEVCTVVQGCRYGEVGLVTPDMVRELRKAIDLLEGEL